MILNVIRIGLFLKKKSNFFKNVETDNCRDKRKEQGTEQEQVAFIKY